MFLIITYLHIILSGLFYQQNKPVLNIRAIATVILLEKTVDLGHDSITTYKGKKYVVASIELFNKKGIPFSMQERHSEGYADWYKKDYLRVVKDYPDYFISSGLIKNFDSRHLPFNKQKLTIIDHDMAKHLLVCIWGKDMYFVNYY